MTLLDTSFLYALTNIRDINHTRSAAVLPSLKRPLFLPTPVLPELCYLLHSRLGHRVMRGFLRTIRESEMRILALTESDIDRVTILLDKYAGARLDFADAAIVAIAEREGITRIATFDRRDFSIIQPRHTAFLELLP